MPSPRRLRVLLLLTLTFVVAILYLTSSSRAAASPHDFYARTRSRLDADRPSKGSLDNIEHQRSRKSGGGDEDDKVAEAMSQRLLDAEVAAKELANKKAPTKESVTQRVGGAARDVDAEARKARGKDRNVAGRKKFHVDEVEKPAPADNDEAVEAELNSILKMSPIIIFSKSYCHFSLKAKSILLDKYAITPTPYVVELDKHPLGAALQAHLATMTGRRTVPNVLVKGKSIGGGDDIAALDEKGELAARVGGLGGRGVSVTLREGGE